jgi:carbamoyltransferase
MIILGIHDGHNSGATLLKDGKVIFSISEERLSRKKNDVGYPKKAIEEVLNLSNVKPEEIDTVALSTKFMHPRDFFLNFDWYKKGEKDQFLEQNTKKEKETYFLEKRVEERKEEISNHLGISKDRISIIEHHLCHAATAYFGSPWVGEEKVLVLTSDGSGDGVSATVNIAQNGKIERIAETKSKASLGKIYSRITYLLGMRPWEHEYKIMGLAPYADKKGQEKSYEVIKKLIGLDESGLVFENKTVLWTNFCYNYLKDNLENHRFDWIAGAVQQVHEELTLQWVKNAIEKTGIKKVVCGGGSFMNVKANMLLWELEDLEDIFVFPSCGDESLSIGAAYQVYADKKGMDISPLENNYFGASFSDEETKKAIEGSGYKFKEKEDINKAVAELLSRGEIIARFWGRSEWGARALGNRSILMAPNNKEKIRELNAAIKYRDFWMPFAPSVLYERQNDYLTNPKKIKSPFMIMGFRTTERGRKDLSAAMHPYDFTVRPQILEEEFNPSYYGLIKKFEKITGIGAVLNTSFNLHGEPIVWFPQDAIDVFKRSSLKYLAIGNYLISKE